MNVMVRLGLGFMHSTQCFYLSLSLSLFLFFCINYYMIVKFTFPLMQFDAISWNDVWWNACVQHEFCMVSLLIFFSTLFTCNQMNICYINLTKHQIIVTIYWPDEENVCFSCKWNDDNVSIKNCMCVHCLNQYIQYRYFIAVVTSQL